MLFTISLPFPEAAVPTFSSRTDNTPGKFTLFQWTIREPHTIDKYS